MAETSPEAAQASEDLSEGYPTLGLVLQAVHAHDEVRSTGVRRVEVNCFASGEATFNVTYVDEDEPVGGYLDKSALGG
jgi:hypothetical protein